MAVNPSNSKTMPNGTGQTPLNKASDTAAESITPTMPSTLDEVGDYITITHTTRFAGTTTTSTKRVPRNSAEAKLYLSSQAKPPDNMPGKAPLRRPKKRASAFDTAASKAQPVKLNCIEKSKMDWAGFVDREGIADDLEGQAKAKEGYHSRMEFLKGVEEKRDAASRPQ